MKKLEVGDRVKRSNAHSVLQAQIEGRIPEFAGRGDSDGEKLYNMGHRDALRWVLSLLESYKSVTK